MSIGFNNRKKAEKSFPKALDGDIGILHRLAQFSFMSNTFAGIIVLVSNNNFSICESGEI